MNIDTKTLVAGEYYRINGTRKILYWCGEAWHKPVRDLQKRFGIWVSTMNPQPTNIRKVAIVNIHKV
jgi:hypothetical protein